MRKTLLALMAVALVAACGGAKNEATPEPATTKPKATFAPGSAGAAIQQRGKLIVGVKYDVPQIGNLNPTTSKPEGFDVDLANIIGERMGVPVEFLEAATANRIPFLQQDKVDIVVATLTITAERRQQIDFSNVYYVAGQSLLVKKDSTITDVRSLNSSKSPVCAQTGSTSSANLRRLAPQAPLTELKAAAECFQALQNGQVQAVSTDDVQLLRYVKQDPANYKLVGGTFSVEPYGVGIKKGKTELVEFVNEVLDDVKDDGTWLRLYNKWIRPLTGRAGTPPADTVTPPPAATAAPTTAAPASPAA